MHQNQLPLVPNAPSASTHLMVHVLLVTLIADRKAAMVVTMTIAVKKVAKFAPMRHHVMFAN